MNLRIVYKTTLTNSKRRGATAPLFHPNSNDGDLKLNIELTQFTRMAGLFLEKGNLDCYASYLHELQKHYDFTYDYSHEESITAEAKNTKMDMSLYIDLTVHKGRIQVRERTFRGDTQIGNVDHQIQRDQDDRRASIIRLTFTRLAHFSK